jgi:hypothetical protein
MNFNGTGGVFRKEAILEAGNWQDETLTEDIDLSYRVQLAGWRCRYLVDLVAPAEIPADINAFKSQQYRWAKGSIQTAIKLLPRVWRSNHDLFRKFEATIHLTHHLVNLLVAYLALATPPILIWHKFDWPPIVFTILGVLMFLSCTGPSRLYLTSERYIYRGWTQQILLLPFLMAFGCGVAINNSRAVLEAILGMRSGFIRTPKRGDVQKRRYQPIVNPVFIIEIATGLWCLSGLIFYVAARHYVVGYFLLTYAVGFLYVGCLSVLHEKRQSA